MGRTLMMIALLAAACRAGAQTPARITNDWQTAAMIAANAGMATAMEEVYDTETDSVRANRAGLFRKTTLRHLVKMADDRRKTNLGNLTAQGAQYAALVREVTALAGAVATLARLAPHYPLHAATLYRGMAECTAEAESLVRTTLVTAFAGKVPDPFTQDLGRIGDGTAKTVLQEEMEKDGDARKTDGVNLLAVSERMRLVDRCITGLRRIRYTVEMTSGRLRYTVWWRDYAGRELEEDEWWAMAMKYMAEDTERLVRNGPW